MKTRDFLRKMTAGQVAPGDAICLGGGPLRIADCGLRNPKWGI